MTLDFTHMLVARCRLDRRQAIIDIGINAFDPDGQAPSFDIHSYRALIDTGAMRTCLTYRAVGLEGLHRHSRRLVKNVHSENLHGLYMAQIGIFATDEKDGGSYSPNRSYFGLPEPTEIMSIADNERFDAILGMDVLRQFDFRFYRDAVVEIDLQ